MTNRQFLAILSVASCLVAWPSLAEPPATLPTATAVEHHPSAQEQLHEAKITCPTQLKYVAAINEKIATGWSVAGDEQKFPLKGSRLFKGPLATTTVDPRNELTAVPYIDRDRGEFQQVWTLEPALLQAGLVLACDYAGSDQFLIRVIPPETKECTESTTIDRKDNSTMVVCR